MVCTTAYEITASGKFFMAVSFLILGGAAVVFSILASKAAPQKRKFFFVTILVNTVAALAYFTMLSGQGWTLSPTCRQVFSVRYLDWAITTPLLVLDLGLLAGVEMTDLIALMGLDVVMVFTGYMAALSLGNVKWMWFIFSSASFAGVASCLLRYFRACADLNHVTVSELFRQLLWLTLGAWAVYPLIWILAEGTNTVPVTFEALAYGFLDIASKAVFGGILLMNQPALDRVSNVKSTAGYQQGIPSGTYGATGASPQDRGSSSSSYEVVQGPVV